MVIFNFKYFYRENKNFYFIFKRDGNWVRVLFKVVWKVIEFKGKFNKSSKSEFYFIY